MKIISYSSIISRPTNHRTQDKSALLRTSFYGIQQKDSFENRNDLNFKALKENLFNTLKQDKKYDDKSIKNLYIMVNKSNINLFQMLLKRERITLQDYCLLLLQSDEETIPFLEKLAMDEKCPTDKISDVLVSIGPDNIEEKIEMYNILKEIQKEKNYIQGSIDLAEILINTDNNNFEAKKEIYNFSKKIKNIPPKIIPNLIYFADDKSKESIKYFLSLKDKKDISQLNRKEKNILLDEILKNKEFCETNATESFITLIPHDVGETIDVIKKLTADLKIEAKPLSNNELKEINDLFKYPLKKDSVTLKKIIENPSFKTLSQNDQKLMLLVEWILEKTAVNEDTALTSYFISRQLGFSEQDSEKVSNIVCTSNQKNVFEKRKSLFDITAFKLKEQNTYEMAKILYQTKEKERFTNYFVKALEKRINDMRANDFVLPQTPREDYLKTSTQKIITRENRKYNVMVVDSTKLNHFNAFVHTPDNAYITKGHLKTNIAVLERLRTPLNNKTLNTCYIRNISDAVFGRNGFIMEVPVDKMYIGSDRDLWSLSRNTEEMVAEFYQNNIETVAYGGGKRYPYRKKIAQELKKYIPISEAEYIEEIQKIKVNSQNRIFSYDVIEKLSPKMSFAYKHLLSEHQTASDFFADTHQTNEFIVGRPKIIAIYTKNIDELPDEYLETAEKENIPIVV